MGRTEKDRLTVDEAKEKLRERSELGTGPGGGLVGTALHSTKRHPFKAAAVALAVGVALGLSSRTRRTALKALRKALGPGL